MPLIIARRNRARRAVASLPVVTQLLRHSNTDRTGEHPLPLLFFTDATLKGLDAGPEDDDMRGRARALTLRSGRAGDCGQGKTLAQRRARTHMQYAMTPNPNELQFIFFID